MLEKICAEVKNYFCAADDIHHGEFNVSGGTIMPLDFLKEGQYFRIVGSTFNDGVHQYPATDLTDESFTGSVWAMKIPPAFIALAGKIKDFEESDIAKPTKFTSESFGGYSYTKATGANGAPLTWQSVFSKDLNQYRRMSVL